MTEIVIDRNSYLATTQAAVDRTRIPAQSDLAAMFNEGKSSTFVWRGRYLTDLVALHRSHRAALLPRVTRSRHDPTQETCTARP